MNCAGKQRRTSYEMEQPEATGWRDTREPTEDEGDDEQEDGIDGEDEACKVSDGHARS